VRKCNFVRGLGEVLDDYRNMGITYARKSNR
jgi:hypothetical protein